MLFLETWKRTLRCWRSGNGKVGKILFCFLSFIGFVAICQNSAS